MADDNTPEATPAAKPDKKEKGKKGDSKKGGGEEKKVAVVYGADFKHLVRISATDLKGTQKVTTALTGVRGVGDRLAPIVADRAGVPRNVKIGTLTDAQIEKIQESVTSIGEALPEWMVNRQNDVDSGDFMHLIGNDVEIFRKDDINRMKKIRSYRGVRHEAGLPVRGQRTRANGRVGMAVGVHRTGEAAPAAAAAGGAPAAAAEKPKGAPAAGAKPAAAAPAAGAKPAAAGGDKAKAPAAGKPAEKKGGA